MAIYKNDNGTWYVMIRYQDWTGARKQKCKRGFSTRKEAADWELQFKLQKKASVDMTMESFCTMYEEDVRPSLKQSTWLTKENIIQKKILPYLGKRKVSEITAKDVMDWHNQMRKLKTKTGKPLSPTYLKTIHGQLSTIFNHAVKYYDLSINPARKAGALGEEEGKEMYDSIDPRFWEAAKVGGKTYGVPSEKEIGNCPMWVFTKEYVDKYDIPYEDIHTLEDLEPYLKLIQENEPDVVPLYLTKDYTAPTYMDKIQDPIGIEYGDDTLTVKNVFETERMKSTLKTMREYYLAGYINKDAATASDDKSIKRFVTKGDGQPYAELTWGKDLGYEVVASQIMDTQITNASARGALTAINKNSEHPEMELLNLINTDQELRNMLNYGIEGTHWEKVEVSEEEKAAAEGKDYIYDYKAKLIPEKQKDYSAPYWVQGGLFNTYVMDNEPLDKWATFKEFNDESVEAPSFGFDFNLEPVATEVAGFRNVLDEFGKSLYTGSVDPDEYLPKLLDKLDATGVDKVIEEMQSQIDEWKASK